MMIKRVHLIFKTHLDIGFTDLARNVVASYLQHYIPRALDVAQELSRSDGPERFVWTTGSWLIYEYLEQAEPAERARMEAAIAAGDIAWHGLPLTTHPRRASSSCTLASTPPARRPMCRRFSCGATRAACR